VRPDARLASLAAQLLESGAIAGPAAKTQEPFVA
jgi:hypothetical protein